MAGIRLKIKPRQILSGGGDYFWRSMILSRTTIYKFQQNYKQTILSILIFLANISSCDTSNIAPVY